MGAGLFLAACGDNGTADSDGGIDGGSADGGDARVPDATIDARPIDSATADAGLPQPKLVDSDNISAAFRPRIAVNASGRALAVWLAGCTGTNCTEVWGNNYTNGNWGTATKLNTLTGNIAAGTSPEYADVAIDAAGAGVVAWHQEDATPRQRVNVARWSGTAWSASQLLDDGTARARRPHVAAGNGTAVTVWEQGDTSAARRTFAARLTGTTWTPAARIEANTGGSLDVDVGMDPQGNAIAAWSQVTRPPESPSTFREMWSNRLDGTSGNWGTAVVIGTDPNGSAVTPSVAVSANGTAIVAWNEFDTTSPMAGPFRFNIKANRWSGTAWGATAVSIENSTSFTNDPVTAIDATGNGFAAWPIEVSPNLSTVANTMSPTGTWGTLQPVEQFTGDTNTVHVSAGNGNGVVVWSQVTSGQNAHIKGVFFNGSSTGPVLAIENQDGSADNCDVGMDAQGVAHVIWIQNIGPSTRSDVFSATIRP